MELRYSLLCQLKSVDVQTNLLSVFQIIDQIDSVSFPILIPRLSFVAVFVKQPGEPNSVPATMIIKINDEQIGIAPTELQFQGSNRLRFMIDLQGVTIPKAGVFSIEMVFDGQTHTCWKMDVNAVGSIPDLFTQRTETAEQRSAEASSNGPKNNSK